MSAQHVPLDAKTGSTCSLQAPRQADGAKMEWLRALSPSVTGDIELNFLDHKGLHVQAMALDCRNHPRPVCDDPERRVLVSVHGFVLLTIGMPLLLGLQAAIKRPTTNRIGDYRRAIGTAGMAMLDFGEF